MSLARSSIFDFQTSVLSPLTSRLSSKILAHFLHETISAIAFLAYGSSISAIFNLLAAYTYESSS